MQSARSLADVQSGLQQQSMLSTPQVTKVTHLAKKLEQQVQSAN